MACGLAAGSEWPEVYGGVPQLVVPDNPRAVIATPDRNEPQAKLPSVNGRPFQKLPGSRSNTSPGSTARH